jgi:cytochrome P450
MCFFLAMALFPAAQRQARLDIQKALAAHPGQTSPRLPSYAEKDAYPAITALVLEVLRWSAFAPLCLPHTVSEDDVYNGYHITAGSTVLVNVWSIFRNEEVYGPDTESFDPARFLNPDGTLNGEVRDPGDVLFGYGRR